MKKNRFQTVLACSAAAAVLAVAAPPRAVAQSVDGSVFDVGGGLLAAPAPASTLEPGTLVPTEPVADETGAVATGAAPGVGPTQGTGPIFSIRVSSGLTYETEEDGPTETYLGSIYDLGLFTETRNQEFRFNVGGRTEFGSEDDDTIVVDPFAIVTYTLETRPTLLNLDFRIRETEVGRGVLEADFDADDLNREEQGTREVTRARLNLETGRDRRFGTRTELEYREIEYTDVVDPDLVDETLFAAFTEFRFILDRRFELRAFADFSRREEDDDVNVTETDTAVGLGADFLIDRAWTGSLDVALTREEDENIFSSRSEDGYILAAEVTRFLPNGTLVFSADRDASDDPIDTLSVTRTMAFANGADFSGTIGAIVFDDGDVETALGLRYSHEFLRGQRILVALDRDAGEDDDDENIIRTAFSAVYTRDLTRSSQLRVNGAAAAVESTDAGTEDTLSASLGLAYSYDLTEDWSLVARADTRVTFEDGDRTDRENILSLRLERTFVFRP